MKKILERSDTCWTSCLSHQPSEPAYYIVDCRILRAYCLMYILWPQGTLAIYQLLP